MAKLFKDGYFQPNDTVGRSLAGAQLFFYTAGTTSPKNTYTNKELAATNAHPVKADAAGRFPPIWLDGSYDVELKDSSNVLIDSWEDVNATDANINSTAPLQFKTLADLKALEAQNGLTVDPNIGDALHTTGKTTTTDDEGADWVVVAAGTGTPDDDLYVDLDNGLQAERILNNLYRKKNGSDIESASTFRNNLNVYSKVGTFSTQLIASPGATSYDLSAADPGFYLLSAAGDDGVVYWDGSIGTTNVFNVVGNETTDTVSLQIATVNSSGIARRYSISLDLPGASVTINADDTISDVYKVGV